MKVYGISISTNFFLPSALDIGFSYTNIDIAKSRFIKEQNSFLKYDTLLISLFSVISIFLFKNRKKQKILVNVNYVLLFIQIILMYYYGLSKRYVDYSPEYNPVISLIFPLISVWLNYIASKGIKKDEDLVKSYDRIR